MQLLESTKTYYRDSIESGLNRGRNAKAIWQGLVTDHGFAHGYESVKRFVHKLRGSSSPSARAVIFTAPGEEAQVDYGTGPMVRDPQSGKYRRTRLFVIARRKGSLLPFRRVVGLLISGVLTAKMDKTRNLITAKRTNRHFPS